VQKSLAIDKIFGAGIVMLKHETLFWLKIVRNYKFIGFECQLPSRSDKTKPLAAVLFFRK
jgi:hypothetical protein